MVDTARDVAAIAALWANNASGNISAQDLRDGALASVHHDFATGRVIDGDYYVCSTHGDDSNAGTSIDAPFATIQQATTVVSAGDTVYVRGGVYEEYIDANTADGTAANRITFQAYPGETPIVDGANISTATKTLFLVQRDFYTIDGFVIQNCSTSAGFLALGTEGMLVKNCVSQGHTGATWGGAGFGNSGVAVGTWFMYENCISRWNGTPGTGNGDGYVIFNGDTGSHPGYFVNCIAYRNNDDGFDVWQSEDVTLVNCLSLENGYDKAGAATTGDGYGFKFSGGNVGGGNTYVHCRAVGNKGPGFRGGNAATNTFYRCVGMDNASYNWRNSGVENMYLCSSINPGVADNFDASSIQRYCSWGNVN